LINKKVGNGATVKNVSEATDKKQVPCAEGLEISLLIHTDRKREGGGATRGGDVFIMVPAHSMHRVLNKIQYFHAINFFYLENN